MTVTRRTSLAICHTLPQGMVFSAFDNAVLAPRLRVLGLQRETAFACLFDLLCANWDVPCL